MSTFTKTAVGLGIIVNQKVLENQTPSLSGKLFTSILLHIQRKTNVLTNHLTQFFDRSSFSISKNKIF